MNLKTFLEHFDTIAEAPGGIPKLRSLILDLAVRGKLVPQYSDDEPATVLLEKAALIKEEVGEWEGISKEKALTPVEENEYFYDLPSGWSYTRLGEISFFLNGYAFKSNTYVSNSIYQVIRLGNVKNDMILLDQNPVFIPENIAFENKKYLIRENDILITMTGTKSKRDFCFTAVVESNNLNKKKLYLNQRVGCIRVVTPIYIKLINIFLKSSSIVDFLLATATGTANQANIGAAALRNLPIPLPPLAEQKRIVEKVDELMELCDRYEAAKQTRDNLRQKLRGSAIASLMNAETDEELDAAWAFVRDNWHNLSQQPEDVDSLRKSVLQLAVRGKLVPQSIDDETIPKELQKLKINSNDLLSIPSTWIYVKLKNISKRVSVGHVGETSHFYCTVDEGVPFLRSQNVRPSLLDLSNVKYIKKDFHCLLKKSQLQAGDLLFVRVGANRGQCCVVPERLGDLNCANIVFARSDRRMSKYLELYCQAPITQSLLLGMTTGSAQGVINTKSVAELPIAIPPLAEQKRIVAKVDELMQLCDQLEVSLRESQQRAKNLAASAISHLTI